MLHHGSRSVRRISLGSQTVDLKCDSEPAIFAAGRKIPRLRREDRITILEHPEEGRSRATEIGPSHPLLPWNIEHAAQLKNRYMVGADGRTPKERLRGRVVQRLVRELGKKVLFLPLAPARRGDCSARFDNGIYLGCRALDGQAYIGTPSGVIRCRTVRQLNAEERWDREFVLSIRRTPWSPDEERA